MNFTVYEYYLEFMNKGLTYLKHSNYDISMNEKEFDDVLSVINFVREQFVDISRALGISFMLNNNKFSFFIILFIFRVGTAFASIYLIISYIDILIDFKIRVI